MHFIAILTIFYFYNSKERELFKLRNGLFDLKLPISLTPTIITIFNYIFFLIFIIPNLHASSGKNLKRDILMIYIHNDMHYPVYYLAFFLNPLY